MADESEMEKTRDRIFLAQGDLVRKREQERRLKVQADALKDEYNARNDELRVLVGRYENEKFRLDEQQASEAAGNKREEELKEAEINRYMVERSNVEVTHKIGVKEEVEETVMIEDRDEKKEEKEKYHDTVLVWYQPNLYDETMYSASFRIGKMTTVDELHESACEYWGASKLQYRYLWRIQVESADEGEQTAEALGKLPHVPIKETDAYVTDLQQAEKSAIPLRAPAEVWLLQGADLVDPHREESIPKSKISQMAGAGDSKEAEREQGAQKAAIAKSMEGTGTMFIRSFLPWPGIFHTLRRAEKQEKSMHLQKLRLRDLCLTLVIAVSSALLVIGRTPEQEYWLASAVRRSLPRCVDARSRKQVGHFVYLAMFFHVFSCFFTFLLFF
jgi:hypothetical protein